MKNKIEVDPYNERVVAYFPHSNDQDVAQLEQLQLQHQPSKIILYVYDQLVSFFIQKGYELEGKITGFFNGVDGYIVSYFATEERKTSKKTDVQHQIMNLVQQTEAVHALPPLEKGYSLQLAKSQDVKGLVQLYQTVFHKYPTMIFDESYIRNVMGEEYFFIIIKDGKKVVSAASAMVNEFRSAEITDCATDPNYRGKQFLLHLIIKLEHELMNRHVFNAYSLTRALSAGMNVTIKRLGYDYGGKLINNCIISTGYEDMCVWSKRLNKKRKG